MTFLRARPLERRSETRLLGPACSWLSAARLRPGHQVDVIDLSAGGALVEAPVRLLPGTRVELILAAKERQWMLQAEVLRCRVSGLSPEGGRYRAGLRFVSRFERHGAPTMMGNTYPRH